MSSRAFRWFSVFTLAFTLAVISWGAYVRITGSGAGCGSHWPQCNGEVIPRDPSVKTLIEYSHRLSSGLALVAVMVLAGWAFRTHPRGHVVRRAAGASLALMLLEAGLGAGLVLLELVALEASARRALAMSLHLTNTFFLLSALGTCVWHAWRGDGRIRWKGPLAAPLVLTFVAFLWVGASGATAALGDTLTQHGVQSALVSLLMKLRVAHPVIAVAAAMLTAYAASVARRLRPEAMGPVKVLLVLLVAQLFAGILNVALQAPVWMQLVHLLLADLLWLTLVVTARVGLNAQVEDASAEVPASGAGLRFTTTGQ